MSKKIYKGNIVHTPKFGEFEIVENGYIVVDGKKVLGTFKTLPSEYSSVEVVDYGDKLIIPGFVDTHFHAPQFVNRGLGMDKELLPWLETYTFPEESKYSDMDYAKKVYERVIYELWKVGTTRAVLFATVHRESTELLMDIINKVGLSAYVGKVNMDRNCPDELREETVNSLSETEIWLQNTREKYENVKPIITPRFVPSCTETLMEGLGNLAQKYNVPIQSHLSENQGEVEWVKELHRDAKNYASVYDQFNLFGQSPTVMAHCVHNTEEEMDLMAKNKVLVAHSPYSNNNLSSGIAPIRKYIKKGIPVGLATDVSGGHSASIASVMAITVQVSKLKWLESDREDDSLNMAEVLYLATKGGGELFGKVGSFEEGYEFDALVIDDTSLLDVNERSIEERFERFIYIGDDRNIVERYVSGIKVDKPGF